MTRVLMFVPQYPFPVVGGLEKQAHELARTLVAQGVHVEVLSGKITVDQPDEECLDGVSVTRIRWSSRKLVRIFLVPLTIATELWGRRATTDLIHLHQHSWVSIYVLLLAKLARKPVITKIPSVGDFGLPGIRRGRLGRLRHAILLASDAIVAMSPVTLEELRQAGYPQQRVLLTPNGIALSHQPAEGGHDGVCRVVFVGRLNPVKQLDVLLDAWAMVQAEIRDAATLEIWGEGPLADVLEEKCRNLGLFAGVRFCGHVHDAARKLRNMDVFVLPSQAEGNSNAVLEAMVAGLPIVSTAVGGTPMQVGPEGAALLCRSGDADELAATLLRLIRDVRLRREVGHAMRRRVETHFDIQRVARTYALAYAALAKGERNQVRGFSNPVVAGTGESAMEPDIKAVSSAALQS